MMHPEARMRQLWRQGQKVEAFYIYFFSCHCPDWHRYVKRIESLAAEIEAVVSPSKEFAAIAKKVFGQTES